MNDPVVIVSAVRTPMGGFLGDFKDASAAETLEHLRRAVLVAMLREIQGVTEELSHTDWKRHQIPFAALNPDERLFLVGHI